ncbi:MAG: hypothetical protein WCY92_15335 [Novosphingobium sp.]
MGRKLSLNFELMSAWCGPVFAITFLICFGFLGHNIPSPPSPALPAAEIGDRIVSNLGDLRLGWVLGLVCMGFYLPWSAQISAHMARIEQHARTMTYTQLIGGALTVFVVSFAILCWSVATFRPGRDPELMQLLTDFGWLSLETQWVLTTVQMWAMAFIGLADRSETPVWPRWVCWLSIWCGLTFIPASLTQYLKTGPFAWDGMLSYYIPYPAWLIWCGAISWYMIRNVRQRMAAPGAE